MGCGQSQHDQRIFPESDSEDESDELLDAEGISLNTPEPQIFPPPAPPSTTKSQIFEAQKYAELDQRAKTVASDYLFGSLEELVQYLISGVEDDIGKVRVLFMWLASQDIPYLQHTMQQLPTTGTPLERLLRIHWKVNNYAYMFAAMCRAANLQSVILFGINKNARYQLGQPVSEQYLNAQWNAVLIDGTWRLFDLCWASMCVVGKIFKDWDLVDIDEQSEKVELPGDKEETKHWINEFFFMTDPEVFIHTHLPDDEKWQLLPEDRRVSVEQFESEVYLRERFHELGINTGENTHTKCVLETVDGMLTIDFSIKEDSDHLQFKYLLYKQRDTTGEGGGKMERLVFYQQSDDLLAYNFRFPVEGKYKFDIFSRDTRKHAAFDLICSYIINCPEAKVDCEPYPDDPDIGWGPGTVVRGAGLEAMTHKNGIVNCEDGLLEIRFSAKHALSILQNIKHNHISEWLLKKYAVIYYEDDELVLSLRLRHPGEYALNMFGGENNFEGDLPNICNYLINVPQENPDIVPFPVLTGGVLGQSFLAERFGLEAIDDDNGLMLTDTGKISVTFHHPTGPVDLFCQLHSIGIDSNITASLVERSGDETSTTFTLDLDTPGEYGLDIYAKYQDEEYRLYHVFTYLIICGSDFKMESIGNETPVVNNSTPNDHIVVEIANTEWKILAVFTKKNSQDVLEGQLQGKEDDTGTKFDVHIKELGEYDLRIMESHNNGAVVLREIHHIIRREKTQEEIDAETRMEAEKQKKREDSKLKPFRDQLNAAIAAKDKARLIAAMDAAKANGLPSSDLVRPQKVLFYLEANEALTAAMSQSSISLLRESIKLTQDTGMTKYLAMQLQTAMSMLARLERIDKLKKEIQNLNQKTIAEIRSYKKPPSCVHTVMKATFILLGENDSTLKNWTTVQALIGKTGRLSLKRRVAEFSLDKLTPALNDRIKKILSRTDLEDAREASSGTAIFFAWCQAMIDEADSRAQ